MTHPDIDYPIESPDENGAALGERFLLPGAIALPAAVVHWAAEQSQRLTPAEADPWRLYVQFLALRGVQLWLQERLGLGGWVDGWMGDWVPVSDPAVVRVNATPVHLLPINCLEDGSVDVPQRAIASPAFDFHLLVEVLEEIEQIQVRGFLPHAELVEAIQTHGLQPDREANYAVPVDWFDLNPDRFLFLVEGAEPAGDRPEPDVPSLSERLAQPVINAAIWLRDQLDQVAQDVGWYLLPTFSYSPALRSLRSPVAQLDGIVADLTRHQSVTIPTTARAAAYDFRLDEAELRLYLLTWELPTAGDVADWILLVILSPQPDTLLPLGTTLQIRDAQTLLSEPTLQTPSSTFLYAQVVGTQNEQFWVSVRSASGLVVAVPPITFR